MIRPDRSRRTYGWGLTLSIIALIFLVAAIWVKTQDDRCRLKGEIAVRGTFGRIVCVRGEKP